MKKEQIEQSTQLGKENIKKTLRRMKRISILDDLRKKPQTLGFNQIELVYAALANGQLTVRDIIDKYQIFQ